MGRHRNKGYGLPKQVYWQNKAWRYKAVTPRQKAVLGKTWILLGKTEDEVHQHYWNRVGSKLGDASGMDKLWETYKKVAFPRQSERTKEDNKKMWAFMQPMFADCHPGSITRTWGIQYLKSRGITGIQGASRFYEPAPSRASKEYALLRHMLTVALDEGIIATNPLKGVRVKEYLNIKVRDRTPEVWELIEVKKVASIDVALFIDFKYMTGLDQSTIVSLSIPSFDLPGIPVKRSKTNKKGHIPWTEDLIQVVRELIAYNNNRCDRLFCNTKGNPLKVATFAQRFRRCVKEAIALGKLAEEFTPNDIRSGHATDAEEIHGLDATKQLLNSEGARKHYVHKRRGDSITALPRPIAVPSFK